MFKRNKTYANPPSFCQNSGVHHLDFYEETGGMTQVGVNYSQAIV